VAHEGSNDSEPVTVEPVTVDAETVDSSTDDRFKVVPMFIDSEVQPQPANPAGPAAPKRKSKRVGWISLGLAVVAAILLVAAIVISTDGAYVAGSIVGVIAIGFSAWAVIIGAVAILFKRGRRLAIAGVILGLFANPVLLLWLLLFAGRLQTG
jgi:hypothetical protein